MWSATYLPRVWLGSRVWPQLLPRDIRPLSAHIKLTENCQAKCISCDYWKKRWPDAIGTEQAIDLVNQISGAGIRSLRLTGGEPLLRKDIFQVLREADTSGFKRIVIQTNGLLLKKLYKEVNDSPITKVAVSVDGLQKSNDLIRGIQGYFRLAMEGLRLLRGKKLALSVTLNHISALELTQLREAAAQVGAEIETNILSRSLPFFENADIASMWPTAGDTQEIQRFVRDELKRPGYEVEYITKLYNQEHLSEPPCVLGFLQVFVLSNGDVLTGCYPLKPVGNVLKNSLKDILASEEYHRQSVAMVHRECPGCTCGVESSLAMQHSVPSAFFEMSRLLRKRPTPKTDAYLPEPKLPERAEAVPLEAPPQMNVFKDTTARGCASGHKL
jgi:MoaA/NifB/PqqE/SkfB family radical SAM enzyme